jgi:hypothetical protein
LTKLDDYPIFWTSTPDLFAFPEELDAVDIGYIFKAGFY